jgi:DNA mismatch repair protein MSH5
MGRTLMRQWFLRPTIELDVISSRQNAVDCFVRPENGEFRTYFPPDYSLTSLLVPDHIVTTLQNQLRSIKQVNKSMRLLANGRGVLKEWQDIWRVSTSSLLFAYPADHHLQFVYTAIMTADAVRGLTHRSGIPILGKLLTCFDREVFNELGETINDVVRLPSLPSYTCR